MMNTDKDKKIAERAMFGCDPQEFLDAVTNSIEYKMAGANIIVAGLMSDAQEEIEMGFGENARQTLNRAKYLLFKVMAGQVKGSGEANGTVSFVG